MTLRSTKGSEGICDDVASVTNTSGIASNHNEVTFRSINVLIFDDLTECKRIPSPCLMENNKNQILFDKVSNVIDTKQQA
jgi:glutaredoxin-related protein